jgi:hypothetical protein
LCSFSFLTCVLNVQPILYPLICSPNNVL